MMSQHRLLETFPNGTPILQRKKGAHRDECPYGYESPGMLVTWRLLIEMSPFGWSHGIQLGVRWCQVHIISHLQVTLRMKCSSHTKTCVLPLPTVPNPRWGDAKQRNNHGTTMEQSCNRCNSHGDCFWLFLGTPRLPWSIQGDFHEAMAQVVSVSR